MVEDSAVDVDSVLLIVVVCIVVGFVVGIVVGIAVVVCSPAMMLSASSCSVNENVIDHCKCMMMWMKLLFAL